MTKKQSVPQRSKKAAKMAMEKVRKDVASFLKGKPNNSVRDLPHLGEYPLEMDTAIRTIIALQDAYDKLAEKHKRASGMVAKQLDDLTAAQNLLSLQGIQFENTTQALTRVADGLEEALLSSVDENKKLQDKLHQKNGEHLELESELTAALQVIRTLQK